MNLKTEEQIKKQNKLFIVLTLVFTTMILSGYFGHWIATKDFIEGGIIVQEGNVTYQKYLDNYYDVDYEKTTEGTIIKINNPCIEIIEGKGESMKPYWDNKDLIILDTCYPVEDLVIGDIIIYYGELDSTLNIHHRIVDIDYNKGWVQTQGDNNDLPDDFVSFDRILGKDIGVLNVLEDKKVVKEEIKEESTIFTIFNESNVVGVMNVTSTYFDDLPFIQISLETCWETTCPCAENTSTPCMVMCYECEESI